MRGEGGKGYLKLASVTGRAVMGRLNCAPSERWMREGGRELMGWLKENPKDRCSSLDGRLVTG